MKWTQIQLHMSFIIAPNVWSTSDSFLLSKEKVEAYEVNYIYDT